MKSVIFIEPQETVGEEPVKFTYWQNSLVGWQPCSRNLNKYEKIVYLGKCSIDGDMFAAHLNEIIFIFKGYLNSGKY